MKADQKSLETVFLIVICRHLGDKWQSKTLFLTNSWPMFINSIYVFDWRQLGVLKSYVH